MNKNVVLVAETGADITPEQAQQYGIYIVPMHVTMGNDTLDDGSFPVTDLYAYYEKTGKLPKTSAASPEDFTSTFDEIHARFPEKHILHLAYSAQTTCSYENAVVASVGRDYVTSIDTKQVSGGQCAVVIKVAQLLQADPDMSAEQSIEMANRVINSVHMCFLPDDLEYLRAGGRVSNVACMGSRLFHIHPCIEVINGLLTVTKKLRGSLGKIAPRLIRDFSDTHAFDTEILYFLWSKGLKEEVRVIAEAAAKQYGYKKVQWIETGCVITSHGGPGAFGVVGYSKTGA